MPLQRKYGQGLDGVAVRLRRRRLRGRRSPECSWGAALAPGTPTFDHGKEIFDTGRTADNNLSMSGGNDRTTFYLSGGLTSQEGTIVGPNNKYNRASLRLKGTHQLNNQLNVGGNFSYVDSPRKVRAEGIQYFRTPPGRASHAA